MPFVDCHRSDAQVRETEHACSSGEAVDEATKVRRCRIV
jgi:hypothetical protein